MLVATFDIGTTAVKAVTVRDDGEPVFTGSQVIHTIEKNGFKEQNPEEWYSAFCALSHALTDKNTGQRHFRSYFFRSDAGCDTSWK